MAALAYAGWWVSGLLIWLVENRDGFVRFHASQSIVAFGAIGAAVVLLGGAAATSLVFLPATFALWVGLTGLIWTGGLVLWVAAMWHAAAGRVWRIPVAADLADRLSRIRWD